LWLAHLERSKGERSELAHPAHPAHLGKWGSHLDSHPAHATSTATHPPFERERGKSAMASCVVKWLSASKRKKKPPSHHRPGEKTPTHTRTHTPTHASPQICRLPEVKRRTRSSKEIVSYLVMEISLGDGGIHPLIYCHRPDALLPSLYSPSSSISSRSWVNLARRHLGSRTHMDDTAAAVGWLCLSRLAHSLFSMNRAMSGYGQGGGGEEEPSANGLPTTGARQRDCESWALSYPGRGRTNGRAGRQARQAGRQAGNMRRGSGHDGHELLLLPTIPILSFAPLHPA
jgi:hypothetical protein